MSQTNEQNIQSHPLASEPIGKLIVKFAVPSVISMLVNSLYNIVDQIFIGQGVGFLGNAATNVAFPMTTICMAVAFMVADGGAAYYSLKLGEGDQVSARRTAGTCLTLSALFGAVFLLVGTVFLNPMLRLFGATTEVMPYAVEYTRIIVIGLPFVVMGAVLNCLIRADGSPKYAMVCMLIGAVINTVLDPIFIFGLNQGVHGAAVATIIGQIATFLVSALYIPKFKNIKLTRDDYKFRVKMAGKVCSLGISSGITQAAITLVVIVMNNSLTYYGAQSIYGKEIPLAAQGIVMKVNQILISLLVGTAIGAQPIIGYNYGAKNYHRVKKTYLSCAAVATVFSVLGFSMFMFFPQSIVNIFGQEDALYNEFAVKCFRTFLAMCVVSGFQITTANFFQSIGKPLKAAMLTLSRQVVFLIPMILILPRFFGLDGVLYAGPVADFSAFLLALVMGVSQVRRLNQQHQDTLKGECAS